MRVKPQLTRPVAERRSYAKDATRSTVGEETTSKPEVPEKNTPLYGGGVFSAGSVEQQEKAEQLLATYMALPVALRKQLLARLALHATSADTDGGRDLDMVATALYEGLARVVGGEGRGVPGPAAIKRVLVDRGAWRHLSAFFTGAGIAELPVAKRQVAITRTVDLLVDRAADVGRINQMPVSVALISTLAAEIGLIVNAALPGYARSGLLLGSLIRVAPDGD